MIGVMLNVFMCMISLHHVLLNEEIDIRTGDFFFFQRHRAKMWQRTKFLSLRFEILSCASVVIWSH